MYKKSRISLLALILAVAVLITGCVAGKNEGGASANEFRVNLASEPPTLDPALAIDQVSFTVINAMYEGLTALDANGKVIPAAAEKWDVSEDGKTYTFHLHQDAKWSNGDALTANDFVYGWLRALDPNLDPKPSEYAYQLYYIAGAEAYNTGSGNAEDVAIKALDEHTLEVTLNNPTTYFTSMLGLSVYAPIHTSVKENPAFAAEASTIIGNGPFVMTEWKRNNSITLVPNENYHARDEIKFNKIFFTMVNDSNSELNMYETNKIDYAGAPTGSLPIDQYTTISEKYGDEFKIKGTASLYYYLFNTTQAPFDNAKIRQALSMAIDRKLITEKVTMGGQLPAYGLVPPGILGTNDEFRNEYSDAYFAEDVEQAKTLLAEGLAESGLTAMPEFTLTYNTNEMHQKVAEAIVDMWRSNLGITAKIGNEEWGVFLENRNAMNFDVARAGWGADYNDPISYIGLFTSTSGNNGTGYSSPEYDALVAEAGKATDTKTRMDIMAQAEKLFIESHAIIPIYYYSTVYLTKPNLENVYIDFKGDVNFLRGSFITE